MKKITSFSILIFLVGLVPHVAFAGEYVWGVKTANHDLALKSAFALAESRVASRGKGCVGRGRKDATTENLVMQEDGDKVQFGVFISHHDGSCGKKGNIIKDMARETGIDANKIISAWVSGGQ